MKDLLTDRAIEWGARLAAVLRIAMLFFIAYALMAHVGWIDASAVAFAAFLVVRALRSSPSVDASIGQVHVHTTAGLDPGARARAIDSALKSSIRTATKGP